MRVNIFLIILLFAAMPAFAQQSQKTNDLVLKMQHDLNLSGDQVANITQIVERYNDASDQLQKSIDDGTANQSAIDSQQQQLKAEEEQGISQYLRPDQLTEWRQMEGQMGRQKGQDNGESDTSSDEYSNYPQNGQ